VNITIASPNKQARSVEISQAMQNHFSIPINHANTILTQINSGMYNRWFEGKKDLVCIDFGANVGLVSLYMLPACKELICVEPTPSHHVLLTELVKGATYSPHALTGKDEEVVFITGHSTENKVSSADGYGNGKITIQGKPLKYFTSLTKSKIDFCKIDIEGAEMIALTSGNIASVKGKVKVFFVEVHPAYNGGMDENREELIKRFESNGYKVEVLDYQTIVATYGS